MFLIPRCVALRKFLTRGALSEECSNMPSFCNFCSSRMSPLPHAHTSGNMWAARCEYVRKLMHPIQFEAKMAILYPGYVNNSCIGTGRYSAEHWIHSHPSARPCDLSNDRFTWNYDNIPTDDLEIKLEPAPRFEFMKYVKKTVQHQNWKIFYMSTNSYIMRQYQQCHGGAGNFTTFLPLRLEGSC